MRSRQGARSVERGAVWAFMPVVAILPVHPARPLPDLAAARMAHRRALLVGGARIRSCRTVAVRSTDPGARAHAVAPSTSTDDGRGRDHRTAVGADRPGQRIAGEPLRPARAPDRRTERLRLRRSPGARHQLCRARSQPSAVARRARPRVEPPPRPAHRGDHDRTLAVGAGRPARTGRLLPRERRTTHQPAVSVRSRRSWRPSVRSSPSSCTHCRGSSRRRCVAATRSRTSSATPRSSRPTAERCAWDSAASWRAPCASCWHVDRAGDRSAGGHGSPHRIRRRGPGWPVSKRSCGIRRAERV